MEESRNHVSPTLLDEFSLNSGHSSAIEGSASGSLNAQVVISAHAVNC